MDLVQTGAVHAIDLKKKQEELRSTDQQYIQVCQAPHCLKHLLCSALLAAHKGAAHIPVRPISLGLSSACGVSELCCCMGGPMQCCILAGLPGNEKLVAFRSCRTSLLACLLRCQPVMQAKLAQLHRHAEVMLDSVLNNPNVTADTVKAMAQEERCATIWPGAASMQNRSYRLLMQLSSTE